MRRREVDNLTFEHDVAPPHYAVIVRDWLKETFNDRMIYEDARNSGHHIRQTYIYPSDFYLWGYLKSKLYQDPIPSLEEQKSNIKSQIRKIMGNN